MNPKILPFTDQRLFVPPGFARDSMQDCETRLLCHLGSICYCRLLVTNLRLLTVFIAASGTLTLLCFIAITIK